MREKIQQWEKEIEQINEKQKELIQKNDEKKRELRRKIQEAEQALLLENNQMIAEAVREIYGEVNEETLEAFKQQMKLMRGVEKPSQHESENGNRL